MAIKVVMIFQQTTLFNPGTLVTPVIAPAINYAGRQHLGGWSELVFWPTNSVKDCIDALTKGANGLQGLLPARSGVLNGGASIVGVKLYQGGAGKGQTLAVAYPGNPIFPSDIPQMALLCKCGGQTTAAVRHWTLRGIPDSQVSQGEFAPGTLFITFLQVYFQSLANFAFQAIDTTLTKTVKINSITSAGNLKTATLANPFGVPSIVQISRTIDSDGVLQSLKSSISAPTAPGFQFLIDDWAGSGIGATTKGTAVQNTLGVFMFNPATASAARIITRRVGRPFEQYRGRRSKRRRVA